MLLALHLLIAAAIVGFVLMQRSEGGALGIGAQGDSFGKARARPNLLTRMTGFFGVCFFLTSMALALAGRIGEREGGGLLERLGGGGSESQRRLEPLRPPAPPSLPSTVPSTIPFPSTAPSAPQQ